MIFEKVKEIEKMEIELDKELSKMTFKEAIAATTLYAKTIITIEDYFATNMLSGTDWIIDISRHSNEIRFWNHKKAQGLPVGSYYEVYFDHNFNVIKSTATDEDISEILEILNNTDR